MPVVKAFIDSNTFLYTFDALEIEKGKRSQTWLRQLALKNLGVTNLQVLNEVASVSTRKLSRFGEDPFFRIDAFAKFGSSPITFETTLAARRHQTELGYSWWDCLLLASAIELGCSHFLSEDLQDGHVIDGGRNAPLTIVSPFAHSPDQILSR